MDLDVKNRPTSVNSFRIGSLIASIVHPRQVMKSAILSYFERILVSTTIVRQVKSAESSHSTIL
ncbi:hypothetical protein [Sporosarcina sp. FSL K6-5500]|uniref:hypothetical protein n=1 Tax=Sporosarcina sp. FSL K6-5500 TaxID=2921558 RepID=UPI0030F70D90